MRSNRLPEKIAKRLRLPLIAAPMLAVSGPALAIAACKAGVIGSFPLANARSIEGVNAWLKQMSTTYRVPVQPDHTITIHGFITNKNPADRTAEIDVWMENEESERLVTGTATVEFRK